MLSQLFILWDFVDFSNCGILSTSYYGILSNFHIVGFCRLFMWDFVLWVNSEVHRQLLINLDKFECRKLRAYFEHK